MKEFAKQIYSQSELNTDLVTDLNTDLIKSLNSMSD